VTAHCGNVKLLNPLLQILGVFSDGKFHGWLLRETDISQETARNADSGGM
jgi:hypothetical protein